MKIPPVILHEIAEIVFPGCKGRGAPDKDGMRRLLLHPLARQPVEEVRDPLEIRALLVRAVRRADDRPVADLRAVKRHSRRGENVFLFQFHAVLLGCPGELPDVFLRERLGGLEDRFVRRRDAVLLSDGDEVVHRLRRLPESPVQRFRFRAVGRADEDLVREGPDLFAALHPVRPDVDRKARIREDPPQRDGRLRHRLTRFVPAHDGADEIRGDPGVRPALRLPDRFRVLAGLRFAGRKDEQNRQKEQKPGK